MKIGLLAMSDNCAERGFISSCHELRAALGRYGDCRLEYCGDLKGLFSALVEALKAEDTVVVAVSPRHYIRCKKQLIAALGVPAVRDASLLDRIAAHAPDAIGPERAAEHALIPQGAEVFPSPDGLYSGFAVKSDRQQILLLSADGGRLPAVISESLIPYFGVDTGAAPSGEGTDAVQEAPEGISPAGDGTEPVEETPDQEERSRDSEDEGAALACAAVAALTKKRCTVAVARTKTAGVLRRLADQADGAEDVLLFSDYSRERGGENPRDHVARLAMGALETEETDYGAAISNVFTSGPEGAEMFLYIAAADERGVYVRRLYLQEGERPQDLVQAAVCDLLRCLETLAGGGVKRLSAGAPLIVAQDEEAEERPHRLSVQAKVISGVCAAVLLIVCVIMGVCLRTPSAAAFYTEDALDMDTTSYLASRRSVGLTAAPAQSTTETTEELTTEEPATRPVTPASKPQNDQAQAGGVGGGQTEEKPVIVADEDKPEKDPEEPSRDFSGTFTITTYGYGHGVGMSQWGANAFAQEGRTYDWIVCHYYPGATLTNDSAAGQPGIPSADDIARVVQQEMGSGFETEALKAQAVAAYTYARYQGNSISGMASVSDISKVSDKVRSAVAAVYGQMAVYNGQPINAVFHAMSAGKTAASQTIWGGSIPYLTPAESAGDIRQSNYQVSRTYSAQEMAAILEEALGITMTGDPSGWLTILEQDGAVSEEIGYVKKLRVQSGGQHVDISGNYFRESVMGYSRMRSPCFTITYTP